MLKIKVTVTRGEDVPKRLKRMGTKLRNRRKPMNELKVYAYGRWLTNFNSGGSIYGSWAALSPRSWRRGWNHGGKPLHHKGGLAGNVAGQSAAGKVSSTAVTWAFKNTSPSYPLSHQFGYNPFFDQPERVIWAFNGQDTAHSALVIETFVQQMARSF